MTILDWAILFGTLTFIVVYGAWKTRGNKNIEGYFLGDHRMKWWTIGVSVMATQASAITFLSTPGQAYSDGMGFVQFYLGLPIAMIVLSIAFLPIFYKLKVYTAYEYLENRFDLKTRSLTAFLFLLQRGLAAGITIYAPAIILSKLLGWSLFFTNIFIGTLVIIYTVSGGTKAVSQTQKHQMVVIMTGMLFALGMLIYYLPDQISMGNAMEVAGKMGKMQAIDFSFDYDRRYTFWSGITGGFFLALAYFGTDQSQVSRYLTGRSLKEGRLGLLFNGLLKIPMQFLILFIGIMVFLFYQFNQPPLFFNQAAVKKVEQSQYKEDLEALRKKHSHVFQKKKAAIHDLSVAIDEDNAPKIKHYQDKVTALENRKDTLREQTIQLIEKAAPETETEDTDYVFITFVANYLPKGVVGLLFAVIFSAAMSSTSSELNALANTSCVDFYQRNIQPTGSDAHYVRVSRLLTVFWGMLAIMFATFAHLMENLIQAINILGSVFYGTILGIFLVGFFIKYVRGNAVFIAAVISEGIVLYCYFGTELGFLWYNAVGSISVVLISILLQKLLPVDYESGNTPG